MSDSGKCNEPRGRVFPSGCKILQRGAYQALRAVVRFARCSMTKSRKSANATIPSGFPSLSGRIANAQTPEALHENLGTSVHPPAPGIEHVCPSRASKGRGKHAFSEGRGISQQSCLTALCESFSKARHPRGLPKSSLTRSTRYSRRSVRAPLVRSAPFPAANIPPAKCSWYSRAAPHASNCRFVPALLGMYFRLK